MDTINASRTVSRRDNRVGAQNYDEDLPGQSLLRDYEQRPLQARVAAEVYAETRDYPAPAPQYSGQPPYAVADQYARDERGSYGRVRNQAIAERYYENSSNVSTYSDRGYSDRDYQRRVYSDQSRSYADLAAQTNACHRYDNPPPIVIVDRPPQDYERERHRGPGIGHAILGLAGLASSVAFSYYGRNGGFNLGHGGWGGYRGGCGNWGAYGNGWNNSRYGYPGGYDYGYGNQYGNQYGWNSGGWNNGWNNNGWNNYRHHNNSWAYPLAGLAMSIPFMINRNRNCNNGGWNGGWNRGGWNNYRGAWGRRCR